MDENEIRKLLETETDEYKIMYLKWLLYGDGYYSVAEQNSVYY